MADKKSAKKQAATEDVVYSPAEATPVAAAESFDATKLNNLSVVSLATSVTGFGAVAGVVTGHVALAQLRRSGEKGRGLAIAGLITGYVGIAGFALMSALAIGGHWAQNRFDDNRGFFGNSQQDNRSGGMMGDNGFGRGDRDGNFGGMMGNGQIQGQTGQGQFGQLPGGAQGGTITLDGSGNSTITLPNGQTITLPDGNGMMGGQGFGPQGGKGFAPQGGQGQVQIVPNSGGQNN